MMPPGDSPNRRAAALLAAELRASGVSDACVSPGSRSTPLALALEREGLRPWVVIDERSAGFFALGLARARGRPVALLCTSGTAAANYLPAVVEASLGCVPLVVLTADRPPELRDCRAPQTIDQVGLYGSHVRWSVDVPAPAAEPDLEAYYRTLACRAVAAAVEAPAGPVHLNWPVREPLLDADAERAEPRAAPRPPAAPWVQVHAANPAPSARVAEAIAARLGAAERGLIVCGPQTGGDAAAPVAALARALAWPVLADPLSGLRFGAHDRSRVVDAYDLLLRDPGFAAAHVPEAVLQLGAPPVSKALQRFLAAAPRPCHVVVAPPRQWPEPTHRATDVVRGAAASLVAAVAERAAARRASSAWLDGWLAASGAARAALDRALAAEPSLFEGKVFPVLADLLPAGARLHVGNSLPVRHLDLFLGQRATPIAVDANRGASGIDGVVATAAGAAAAGPGPVVLVVGDLSFLYDLGGLQAAARHRLDLVVVLLNNDGGGIFSFLPQAALDAERFEALFGTPHGLDVAGAAALCGARLARPRSWEEFRRDAAAALRGGLHVIEVRSDRAALRERHAALVRSALAALPAAGAAT
ncbi:MAG: 2-succinyl-5-enolpyruvyl-6-hydroxy-3-cyclohexene-1-carboxylic-acid synthase [Deltaproteobacteria bacterium]|nr:2-succinyl-5-enolpyruvyl-6-hydroxy-3-cyclohexene-1-carboxylic-acid synthase [Deltaproteobacteria bacterium]